MGRPTVFNDIVVHKVLSAIGRGLPRKTAAKIAGISVDVLYKWIRLGREGDPEYTEFINRFSEAEAKGEDELVQLMRFHAKTSWQACGWLLERRNPGSWALKKLQDKAANVSEQDAEKLLEEAAELFEQLKAAGGK